MATDQNAVLVLLEKRQLFPHLLSQKYPHVLSKILEAWESPEAIDACFQGLMFAEPRRKQGFPENVMTEIFALAKFHDSLYPRVASSPLDIWSHSLDISNSKSVLTDDVALKG
ncbi:MAG: hypothetical protein JNM42_05905 [Propionivibrio sp.]|uniref:hypothetical protein n=1 Tax=Propionivibrio sp. TaxID=2212460 RepID=UPI001A4C8393|nr:hypothetical protein [Propionivibrio sp.]MBL8413952.1 hypothetical protein [Propionivibrio sp.]